MRDKLRCSLVYDLIADFSCFAFWRCASDTSPRNKKSALDPEYKVRKKKSIWITFDVFYLYLCPLLKLLSLIENNQNWLSDRIVYAARAVLRSN